MCDNRLIGCLGKCVIYLVLSSALIAIVHSYYLLFNQINNRRRYWYYYELYSLPACQIPVRTSPFHIRAKIVVIETLMTAQGASVRMDGVALTVRYQRLLWGVSEITIGTLRTSKFMKVQILSILTFALLVLHIKMPVLLHNAAVMWEIAGTEDNSTPSHKPVVLRTYRN